MKKNYSSPKMEKIEFDMVDIIQTSAAVVPETLDVHGYKMGTVTYTTDFIK